LGQGGNAIKNQLNGVRKAATASKVQNGKQMHPEHEDISSSSSDLKNKNNSATSATPTRNQRYQLRNA